MPQAGPSSTSQISTISTTSIDTYTLDLGITSEEDAQILIDVKNGSLSEISMADGIIELQYSYKPTEGFLGQDTVKIETCLEKEGDNCINTKYYELYFDVIEPTSYTIENDPCGTIAFSAKIGDNYLDALDSLKIIRVPYTDGKVHYTDEKEVTVTEPIDARVFKSVEFKYTSTETNILDENGNHFYFTACE